MLLGQDAEFATPGSSFLYNSPAMVGAAGNFRVNNVLKSQHPNLNGAYNTIVLSVDHFKNRHGFGGYFLTDNSGIASLRKLEFGGAYSYFIPLSDKLVLGSGIGLGITQYKLDLEEAIFGDQWNLDYTVSPISAEQVGSGSSISGELNLGTVLYGARFWTSLGAFHLNRPSVLSSIGDFSVDPKFVLNAGYVFPMASNKLINRNKPEPNQIITSLMVVQQGSHARARVGAKMFYNSVVGVLSLSNIDLDQPRLVGGLVGAGFKYEMVTFTYGYEIYFGGIQGLGGAHELHVNLLFGRDNKIQQSSFSNKKSVETFCPLK